MWLSFFAVILILAITFYQGLHGLFSAAIMCVLTVLSAALAYALYEPIYISFLIDRQPEHGRAIAMMGVFIVSLLVLRGIADLVITGNMHFNQYVDRFVGGAFGAVTAMVIVGMLATSLQMLPFGAQVLGFRRYVLVDSSTGKAIDNETDDPKARHKRMNWADVNRSHRNVMFNPDGFTVGLMSFLSSNALHLPGSSSLGEVHPDFLDELHELRAHPLGQTRMIAPAGAIKVEQVWEFKGPLYKRELVKDGYGEVELKPGPKQPDPGMKWLGVRVRFNNEARDGDRGPIRFTPEQIVLVMKEWKDRLTPIGISNPNALRAHIVLNAGEPIVFDTKVDREQGRDKAVDPVLDFIFELPEENVSKVWFVQFKQNARQEIRLAEDAEAPPPLGEPLKKKTEAETPEPAPAPAEAVSPTPSQPDQTTGQPSVGDTSPPAASNSSSSEAPSTSPPVRPAQPKGKIHGFNLGANEPFFGAELPFELTDYSELRGFEGGGGEIRGGGLWARLDENWKPREGKKPPISRFQVPEGQQVLQLYVDKLDTQSWLGGILAGAYDKLQNIYVVDDQGKEYMPIGKYAMVNVGAAGNIIEVMYLDETAREMARLPSFSKIRSQHMKNEGDHSFVFLFHVPDGRTIVKFHTAKTDIDLEPFNLTATR